MTIRSVKAPGYVYDSIAPDFKGGEKVVRVYLNIYRIPSITFTAWSLSIKPFIFFIPIILEVRAAIYFMYIIFT